MKVLIGADHRGFKLKELLKQREYGRSDDIEWIDVGAEVYQPDDDYPDYAQRMVELMSKSVEYKRGVLICGSGVGMSITANKFSKVRCGLGLDPGQVMAARVEDNINVLALAADYVEIESAVIMVKLFLETEFSLEPRHVSRIEKIQQIEAQHNYGL